ncbi:MAG: amidase [Deltaproteobacteria bacterium]|nr:amidase [Deltaproteobacteria bacterium]
MPDTFADLDATAQAELIRRRAATPLELVDAAIARIEKLNPQLNAVIIPLFEKARAAALSKTLSDGPFRGVPMLIKDLFCQTVGDPYHAGMRLLRQRSWIADHDTYLATKFREAGFICVGRTNVPELGPLPTTEPQSYGATHNPWDTTRSPGGSSGGSGAAVASRMVPVAHGNDGGGSIRIPSSLNGLFGLKPSRGRVSLGPDFGESWGGAVIEHVLTRSVRDSAAILDAVCGSMPGDPYFAPPPIRPFQFEVGVDPGRLRVGVLTRLPTELGPVDADCAAAANDAAKLLESLGHDIEESFPSALFDPEFQQRFGTMVTSWTARDLAYWSDRLGMPIGPHDVEPYTWQLAEMGRAVSVVEYIATDVWLKSYTRRVAEWWADGFDLLLTPTAAARPPKLGELVSPPEDPMRGFLRSIPLVAFTAPFNVTGQPAASLPLYWNDDGLPIGVQLVAAYGREDVLVRVAAQLENARPWKDRRPRVCAS